MESHDQCRETAILWRTKPAQQTSHGKASWLPLQASDISTVTDFKLLVHVLQKPETLPVNEVSVIRNTHVKNNWTFNHL